MTGTGSVPALEVADLLRRYREAYLASRRRPAPPAELRVMQRIETCRTAHQGGHVRRCDACAQETFAYNSCRDRHCPKCLGSARARWLEARQRDLLDAPHFHVVFTVPSALAAVALRNRRRLYGLLFRAAAATLLDVAANPRHLGAKVGVLAVLHTWGQNLHHHPHLHCVVPGGGLDPEGRWVACAAGFFLPVRVLGRLFRGKLLAALKTIRAAGDLALPPELAEPSAFAAWLSRLYAKEWVVYAKRPFGGAAQVLRYLARYTHRVAIANRRLVRLQDDRVTFRWKDYRHGHRPRHLTLGAVEFLRRFLQHRLPRGFTRIRYYGFLAGRNRQANLQRCRDAIRAGATEGPAPPRPADRGADDPTPAAAPLCTACGRGRLQLVEIIPRGRAALFHRARASPVATERVA